MTKSQFKEHAIQQLRNEMFADIKTINRYMTGVYLDTLSTEAIIGLTHPIYRSDWQDKFDEINEFNNEQNFRRRIETRKEK